MIVVHVSPPASPAERGEELGAAHPAAIAANLERYAELFAIVARGAVDLRALGTEALEAIGRHAPDAAEEIRGIAGGAGLEPWEVALLNARTEVLARLRAPVRGECSTIVALRAPGAAPATLQTWDWHDTFADGWLVWTIEHPDGRVVHMLTEHGILGKIGVNSRGVGIHFNILGHERDGGAIGLPVHVLARQVLDRAGNVGEALALLGGAEVSASSVLTVVGASAAGEAAVCAELCPAGPRFVTPGRRGVLVHTNHFLDPELRRGDRAPTTAPDSYLRHDVLERALASAPPPRDRDDLLELMTSHVGGAGAVCCHPDPGAPLGERWTSLATVSLDVPAGALWVREGGPCAPGAAWHVSTLTTQGTPA
ncbi:MAG TPA: C45 family peptidase [Capillimicrobium sp.]|nr:C45 family peptidase [Capillimicrobium sp.]